MGRIALSGLSSCTEAMQSDLSSRFLQRRTENSLLSISAILARHMPSLNDMLASFMNDLGSHKAIDGQQ